ncbi:MAG: LPS export ABC transporter periplasmic protein LptC [Hyphomicrobium sp.]
MAVAIDSATSAGRARSAGNGIVLAGDRAQSRRLARRHSRFVSVMKLSLPLAAIGTVLIYAGLVLKTTGWGIGIPAIAIPQIMPENLAMENPHYEGFNKDGGRYWVTSERAQQDLKNLSIINLDVITGEIVESDKSKTVLKAARGTFNNKANLLELYDSIDVAGDNGLKAHLTRATIKTKENIITSNEPVVVMMEAGTINANQMTIRQKTKEYTFVDKVRTFLKARESGATAGGTANAATGSADPESGWTAQSQPSAAGFGNASEPIDIVSNRLDVNDATKVAIFTGTVKAVQGTSSLTTPEMQVTYEGDAVAAGGADGKDAAAKDAAAKDKSAGGKVTRVVARNPVSLTQGDGQTVTSRSADFDALTQKAVLEGDVVMSELPDKRAVGDRADIDQIANTVLLTGPVVVTQGANVLKGRRLFFNRVTNKMQLTGQGGGPANRITAHFRQDGGKPAAAKPAAASAKPDAQGIAFGGNFKTDPNAPVDVEADRLDLDDGAKQAIFTGSVRAVQSDFVVQAAELIANYAGSAGLGGGAQTAAGGAKQAAKLTRIQAKKNVVVTSKDGQKATGDWADFDTTANVVTLGGNVIMTQAKNVVRGTKLVIDMTTGESVIKTEPTDTGRGPMVSSSDGDGSGIIIKSGRPSATFYPNQLKEKATKGVAKATEAWRAETAPPATQPSKSP